MQDGHDRRQATITTTTRGARTHDMATGGDKREPTARAATTTTREKPQQSETRHLKVNVKWRAIKAKLPSETHWSRSRRFLSPLLLPLLSCCLHCCLPYCFSPYSPSALSPACNCCACPRTFLQLFLLARHRNLCCILRGVNFVMAKCNDLTCVRGERCVCLREWERGK